MVVKSDYGTKMDDVILESLKPQVEEIKQKLASGGGLSQSDIITLTIYTQGNHINHIDMRMDALCEDFSALRTDIYNKMTEMKDKFSGLEGKFAGLEGKFAGLEGKFAGLEGKFAGLEGKFAGLEEKFSELEGKIETKIDTKLARLEVKLEQFRGDSSKTTAIISSICAASIAIATVVTNIISR